MPGIVAPSLRSDCDKPSISGFNFMELQITNKKGKVFKILYDESDHELVAKYEWHVGGKYVRTSYYIPGIGSRTKMMHRVIMGLTDANLYVDHINRNPFDNRRSNLRICSQPENTRNRSASGECKYLGVTYQRCKINSAVYVYIKARIRVADKLIHLGSHKTEELAAKAYDKAAKHYFGEFANLNFPECG